jgi:hypothetical protein
VKTQNYLKTMFAGGEEDFSPNATEFWQLGRIPHSPLPEARRSYQWFQGDSEANYVERGNKEFSPDSISYDFNSFGYRSDEFDESGRTPSLMFIGCSNTLGIGTPWDGLWTTRVTKHFAARWGIPVRQYNLAWGATGADHVAMMVHQCVDILKPLAVCVLWSYVSRFTWFESATRRYHFLPNIYPSVPEAEHKAYLRLQTDAQSFFNFVKNYNFVAWRLAAIGVPFFCGSLDRFDADTLKHYVPMNSFVGRWNHLDSARDNRHSGVRSHADFADKMIAAARSLPNREGVA